MKIEDFEIAEKLVVINPLEFQLTESKGIEIQTSFELMTKENIELSKIYDVLIKKELSQELSEEAKNLRLRFVKVRTGIAKIHKAEKAVFWNAGKFVDALKNKFTVSVEIQESRLKEIENHFENLEKERIEKLKIERSEIVRKFNIDPELLSLGLMNENIWNDYISGVKLNYDAKIKAEKEAETKRIAEEKAEKERIDKIQAENKKLKLEAIEKEKAQKLELAKIEAKAKELAEIEAEKQKKIQLEIEKKTKQAAEKAEAERKEVERLQEIERKKQAEILRVEQENSEKLRKQAAEKAEAERKEKEQKEKDAQKLLQRGDVEKYKALVLELKAFKGKYSFESERFVSMFENVKIDIDLIISKITA